jgi:NADH:ubiquinone oxidoreductase subunit 3 (subunit A)
LKEVLEKEIFIFLVQIHGYCWGMELYLVLFLSFFLIDYSFTLFIFLIHGSIVSATIFIFMIGLIIVGTIYFILLDVLSFLFSIRLCGTMNALTSDNFKCGFYSILTSSLRYRFNYWMIIIHFVIYEQELILALLWIYSITINLNSNNLCCLLLSILFMELMAVVVRKWL